MFSLITPVLFDLEPDLGVILKLLRSAIRFKQFETDSLTSQKKMCCPCVTLTIYFEM